MIEILEYPKLVAAAVTLLLGLADALRRYRRDGDLRLYQLPWIEFRALFEYGRQMLFTIEKPDHPSFVVNMTVDELQKELGKQGVKPRHPFSVVYRGEVYNGVMYYYDPEKKHPHRQIHPRAFQLEEGLEVMPHEEPHWYHHPIAHLKSKHMEFEPAVEWTKRRLENAVPVGYPDG